MSSTNVDSRKTPNPGKSCWARSREVFLLATPFARRICFSLVGAAIVLGIVAQASLARPLRGPLKFSVILCKTSDAPTPPNDRNYYEDLFFRWVSAYLVDVSYGNVSISRDRSVVKGWYTMSATTRQLRGPIHPECDAAGVTCTGKRGETGGDALTACKTAASTASTDRYDPPSDHNVVYITFPDIDLYGGGNYPGGYAVAAWNSDLAGLMHELGHTLGMQHSYSDVAGGTVYDDPYDLMSCYNCFYAPSTKFTQLPPGLVGWQLDRMGWLPRSRIVVMGADGRASRTITLAALNRPDAAGALLVRIPYNPANLFEHYTVEFRRKLAGHWDSAIPQDIVLIHYVKFPAGVADYRGHLMRYQTGWGTYAPREGLSAPGFARITVDSIDPASNQARVTITTEMVDKCLGGMVPREAIPSDSVCVPEWFKRAMPEENRLAGSRRNSRRDRERGEGICKRGFVPRRAYAGDDETCVSRYSARAHQGANADAANRRNPARFAYGPNTCKLGYVWREADDFDWVCVAPRDRTATQEENRLATSRSSAPGACLAGFVWREAFPEDRVCVPRARRTQALSDNRLAQSRLQAP